MREFRAEPLVEGMDRVFRGPPQDWAGRFDSDVEKLSTPELLRRGILRLGGSDHSIDLDKMPWQDDPTIHPTFRLHLLGFKWLSRAVADCGVEGPSAAPARALVEQVLQDWLSWERQAPPESKSDHWQGHAVSKRSTVLAGASTHINAPWLADAMTDHADWLADDQNWDGLWNHGLMEAVALLALAARLGRGSDLSLAVDRIDQCFSAMVDDQGCINEQAPAYANYILNIATTLDEALAAAGIDPSHGLPPEAKARLRRFIVHATDPTGMFAVLGDSYRVPPSVPPDDHLEFVTSHGERGQSPTERVAVFDQGFIFGRSGWGTASERQDDSFYSIRFGPGRIIHGHNDHMSVTYYNGRDVIVDAGHNGYAPDRSRDFLRSVAAHNVLTVRGVRHDWSAATTLTEQEVASDHQFFRLEDDAYAGFHRLRSAFVSPRGPMVVVDRVPRSTRDATFDQLWHLAREHRLVSAQEGHVAFAVEGSDESTHLVSYIVSDSGVRPPTVSIWQGSTSPLQGWVSTQDGEFVPAPAVAFSETADRLFMVTVITNQVGQTPPGHSLRRENNGWFVLRLHHQDGSWAWRISPGGFISLRSQPSRGDTPPDH